MTHSVHILFPAQAIGVDQMFKSATRCSNQPTALLQHDLNDPSLCRVFACIFPGVHALIHSASCDTLVSQQPTTRFADQGIWHTLVCNMPRFMSHLRL